MNEPDPPPTPSSDASTPLEDSTPPTKKDSRRYCILCLDGRVLLIRENGKTDRYLIQHLNPDPSIGATAIRLLKVVGDDFDSRDLIRRVWGWECSCAHGTYKHQKTGRPCRHLAALLELGVIP